MTPPELEYLFSYSDDIDQPQQGIGAGPFGNPMIAHVTGGRLEGPRLKGEVLPGGGGWALIFASYRGVITPIDPETEATVIAGTVLPGELCYRTTSGFETGDERYAWLNTLVAVAVGNLTTEGVSYDVFGVH